MDIQQNAGLTMCVSKAALANGTTTTLTNTGAVLYSINGKAYSAAALSNTAPPSTDLNTGVACPAIPANFGSIFYFGYNAAGTFSVVMGSIEALDVGGKFINAPREPAMPANFCPFAYLIIQVGSTGSAWTLGSSNTTGATGVTYTYQDIMTLPDRLQYK
jgi:hypothetical protein